MAERVQPSVPRDIALYLALHAEDNGHFWATDLGRMEAALRQGSRCDRQTVRSQDLPWFEFCGKELPCRDHPET